MEPKEIEALHSEYVGLAPLATAFGIELERQLGELIRSKAISLSTPIQVRVKTWESIAEKLVRKSLTIDGVSQLQDLIGVRLIVQFIKDVPTLGQLIRDHFKVSEEYDTAERLKEDQFGYSSMHFIVKMPDAWLEVPTLAKLGDFQAELQLRTTAQHIWAAASHTLQYKHEASVPAGVRRAIHRVAALLEMVDLEFDRVLSERESYRSEIDLSIENQVLNVDLLEKTLDALFPSANKYEAAAPYGELLSELFALKIQTVAELQKLVKKHLKEILTLEEKVVSMLITNDPEARMYRPDPERLNRGVFFAHTGLVRQALALEFGVDWRKTMLPEHLQKRKPKPKAENKP